MLGPNSLKYCANERPRNKRERFPFSIVVVVALGACTAMWGLGVFPSLDPLQAFRVLAIGIPALVATVIWLLPS